jgi:hypothetical protein
MSSRRGLHDGPAEETSMSSVMEFDEDELIGRLQNGSLDPADPLPTGEVPLKLAVRRIMPRLVRALLDAGAAPNHRDAHDEPLLHEAIRAWETGRHGWAGEAVPQMIDMLLVAGADVGARGQNDFTALHLAASHGNEEICLRLMRAGADPSAVAEPYDSEAGRTPYEVAEESSTRQGVAAVIRQAVSPEALERRRLEKVEARQAYVEWLRRGRQD